MKKPFFKTKIGGLLSGLVREGLQIVPGVGTLITVFKEDTPENPKGKMNLAKWDIYRLVLGLVLIFTLAKGILTSEQIEFIMSLVGL